MRIAQGLAVIFALLAGWAWFKSAMLNLPVKRERYWLDDLLNRISTSPSIWNAIAAGLSAAAAVCQGFAYLLAFPIHNP
jgi:hypothetical protein